MKILKPAMLISDFDGTISKKDFFWYLIDNFLTKEDCEPWNDYLNGTITHVQALAKIFEKVHIDKKAFDEFILTLPIEESFVDTVKLCNEKHIPFNILSAGADYYIKHIIKQLKIEGLVHIYSNKSDYSKETGLKFYKFDKNYLFYSDFFGISKKKVVQHFKDQGYFCIFAGDGNPDIEPAQIADVVFARETLLKKCKKSGIKTEKFDSYADIFNFINKIKVINENKGIVY